MPNLNLEEDGVEIQSGLISDALINSVLREVSASDKKMPKYGIRNAEKKFSKISDAIHSEKLLMEAKHILGKNPSKVRVIFFDKTPEKNWLVTWHQDHTVAVNKKFDAPEWEPWSIKDGVHHVQPPLDVLNQMVTFRLHLDRADEQNGCLKVIPGSHHKGILSHEEIQELVSENKAISCIAEAGESVIMRPHIVHSSSKAIIPKHRRIIHVEFSSYKLPNHISWA